MTKGLMSNEQECGRCRRKIKLGLTAMFILFSCDDAVVPLPGCMDHEKRNVPCKTTLHSPGLTAFVYQNSSALFIGGK